MIFSFSRLVHVAARIVLLVPERVVWGPLSEYLAPGPAQCPDPESFDYGGLDFSMAAATADPQISLPDLNGSDFS